MCSTCAEARRRRRSSSLSSRARTSDIDSIIFLSPSTRVRLRTTVVLRAHDFARVDAAISTATATATAAVATTAAAAAAGECDSAQRARARACGHGSCREVCALARAARRRRRCTLTCGRALARLYARARPCYAQMKGAFVAVACCRGGGGAF